MLEALSIACESGCRPGRSTLKNTSPYLIINNSTSLQWMKTHNTMELHRTYPASAYRENSVCPCLSHSRDFQSKRLENAQKVLAGPFAVLNGVKRVITLQMTGCQKTRSIHYLACSVQFTAPLKDTKNVNKFLKTWIIQGCMPLLLLTLDWDTNQCNKVRKIFWGYAPNTVISRHL